MSDIQIERAAAYRVIASVLRDHMSAADVNELATAICDRLRAAMPESVHPPGLRLDRVIRQYPFDTTIDHFIAHTLKPHLPNANSDTAERIWKGVYDLCPEDRAQQSGP